MGVFSFVKAGKKTFDTIKSVGPKVNKTKLDEAKSKLAIQTQKTKASGAKLKQTLFESKNKAFKGDDFTFATNTKKTPKVSEQKANGGRIGRRFGSPKPKTNVQKIKETFSPKSGLKKIDPEKQKGLAKLKKERPDVVRKMGYMKKGGRAGFKGGSDMSSIPKTENTSRDRSRKIGSNVYRRKP